MDSLFEAARAHDDERLDALVRGCMPADPVALYSRVYGDSLGSTLARRRVERLAAAPQSELGAVFRALAQVGEPLEFEAHLFDPVTCADDDAQAVWRAAIEPFSFGLVLVRPVGGRPLLALRDWIHDGERFVYAGPLAGMLAQRPVATALRELAMHLAVAWSLVPGEAAYHAEHMALSDPQTWFVAQFGEALGAELAASYERSLADGELVRTLVELIDAIVDARGACRATQGRTNALPYDLDKLRRGLVDRARHQTRLHVIEVERRTFDAFAFVDGAWRWIGSIARHAERIDALGALPEQPAPPPLDATSAATYSQSAEGLCALVGDQMRASSGVSVERWRRVESGLSALRLPDRVAWLESTFGSEEGAWLAARYEPRPETLRAIFFDLVDRGYDDVRCFELEGPSDPRARTTQSALLRLARRPLSLWTVVALNHDDGDEAVVFSWAYEEGSWRFLSTVEALADHAILPAVLRERLARHALPGETSPFRGSPDGLVALLEAIDRAIADGDDPLAEHLARSLLLPAPERWVPRLYSDRYVALVLHGFDERAKAGWVGLLREAWEGRQARRRHRVHELPRMRPKGPPVFAVEYLHHGASSGRRGAMARRPFVFVDGGWRLLEWELVRVDDLPALHPSTPTR